MKPLTDDLFSSDLWMRALERYASDTHLSVKLFDADERVVFGPVHSTPLFKLFDERGYDPGIFAECARRCFAQTNGRPAVIVSEVYGLAVVGTSLALEGKVVGAAVGGYAFVDFSQLSEVQRLAKDAGLKFEQVWKVAREQKPVPKQRLMLNGELLQVLGDALLRENHRTRQYERAAEKLEDAARTRVLLEAIVASSDDAIISKDLHGIITSWNRGAERLFGYTPQEAIGQPITMLIPPERIDEEPGILARIRRGESIEHYETVRRRKDGSRLDISLTVSPIRDSKDRVIGASKIARDITEHKQAEEALRQSEERYRTLFDLGPVAIYSCDSSGVIQDFNCRAVELWGRTPVRGDTDERFCGSFKLFKPDGTFMPHAECPMADVVSGRSPGVHDGEVFIQRPDGSGITVIVNIHPLKGPHGEIRGAINCFYDITERKQAEEALREAGKRFRFMAESMPQKIFTATPNGDVDYLNPQWMEFAGLSFEQMKDWGWTQLIHPDDVEENVRRWRHSIATGEPFYFEHRVRRADGSYHWHFSRALPMRDASGNIAMWIGSNADIQPIKDQEERLRKSEKMAAAGQLAASLAHEINNPLSSVTNALYLLENHKILDDSARLFVKTATTELARVSRIVRQSLSYYRVGSVPHDLDLGVIVDESLQIFRDKFQKAGIELKTRIQDGTLVVGFADELRQVTDNLLLNAMEAMPNGGRLSVSMHDSCDWTNHQNNHRKGIRLTIADTGGGIPRDQQRRIFEPFFTTKAEKGTGLGLWVLQGIVSKHEGSLNVRSSDTEGRSGTVVSIFLPSHTRAPVTSNFADYESAA